MDIPNATSSTSLSSIHLIAHNLMYLTYEKHVQHTDLRGKYTDTHAHTDNEINKCINNYKIPVVLGEENIGCASIICHTIGYLFQHFYFNGCFIIDCAKYIDDIEYE